VIKNRLVIYGDASGAAGTPQRRSDYQMIASSSAERRSWKSAFAPGGNPAVRDASTLGQRALLNARGEQQVVVDPRVKGLINDLEQVSYQAGSTQIDKNRDPCGTLCRRIWDITSGRNFVRGGSRREDQETAVGSPTKHMSISTTRRASRYSVRS